MQRDEASLLDILEAAKLAVHYVSQKSYQDFLDDIQCQDAVVRRLEVIGEAARRISDETSRRYPQVPWQKMVSMRNVMIHQYDEIDFSVVWDTVQQDLPPLIAFLTDLSTLDS